MIFHRTKILSVHLSVAYPGEGPPLLQDKMKLRPEKAEKKFFETGFFVSERDIKKESPFLSCIELTVQQGNP